MVHQGLAESQCLRGLLKKDTIGDDLIPETSCKFSHNVQVSPLRDSVIYWYVKCDNLKDWTMYVYDISSSTRF